MAQNYQTWSDVINQPYSEVENIDYFPFHNQWRGRPLSKDAYIRDNAAGYYPYNKVQRVIKQVPTPPWQYTYYFPCSTIFPVSDSYKTNGIILER